MSLIKDEYKSPNSQSAEGFFKEVTNSSNDCPSCLRVKNLCLRKVMFLCGMQYSSNFSIIFLKIILCFFGSKVKVLQISLPLWPIQCNHILNSTLSPFESFSVDESRSWGLVFILSSWHLSCLIQMIVYLVDWILPCLISAKCWCHQRGLIVVSK